MTSINNENLPSKETNGITEDKTITNLNIAENGQKKNIENDIDAPDGGWGWFVVFASFMCNLMIVGLTNSFGVFLVPMVNHYDSDRSLVSWVGSLMLGSYLMTGIIAGALVNRFGCRTVCIIGSILASATICLSTFSPNVPVLMITYGVLGGFSLGLIYLPAVVAVGYYFKKKRALATGIVTCGAGVGAFVYAPLTTQLELHLGWQNAIRILAGFYLTCILFGLVMRPLNNKKKGEDKTDDIDREKEGSGEEKENKNSFRNILTSILKNPYFLLVAISQAIASLGFFIPFIFLPDMAVLKGFPVVDSNFLLSVIAITNTVGRIIIGLITDIPCVDSLMMTNLSIILLGVATLVFPFCTTYPALVIVALLFGLGVAGLISLASIVMVDLLGLDNLNVSFGLLTFFKGIATVIGPPLAGVVYDATKSYDAAFYFGGGVLFFASFIGFGLQILRRKRNKHQNCTSL